MNAVTGAAGGPSDPPAMDWNEISGIARAAFFTVKRALLTERPDIARHVMTEDAWERLRAQVEVLQHDGCANRQKALDITDVSQSDHEVDGMTERVVARLMLAGVDCVVEQATGRVVSGRGEASDWREEWTFERSRDPQLQQAARAPKCPNCGAPLSINSDGLCSFCQAVVPGAKTDWLLASIGIPSMAEVDPEMDRQAGREANTLVMNALAAEAADHPWVGTSPAGPALAGDAAAGIAAIQRRDAAFNASEVVVEAREVFLKLEDSRNQLRPTEVRAMVGDVLYAKEADRARQMVAAGQNEVRPYLDISSVTIVDAGTAAGWDRLVIRVSAVSGRSTVNLHTGDISEGSVVTHSWSEDLLFERRDTCTTNALTGLLAHRCPACGQPAQVTDEGLCQACGQHVTGGERDWILVNVKLADPPAGA